MSSQNVADAVDPLIEKRQSAMRRRSSMFEVDLDLRKGRGDSIISIDNGNGSILDIQRRRKNYENTYKTEPDEKPQMKLVRDTISEIINGKFKLVIILYRHLVIIFSIFYFSNV